MVYTINTFHKYCRSITPQYNPKIYSYIILLTSPGAKFACGLVKASLRAVRRKNQKRINVPNLITDKLTNNVATATIFEPLSWSRNQHKSLAPAPAKKTRLQAAQPTLLLTSTVFVCYLDKKKKFQGRNLLPAMPAAGSLPARTRRNVTPKSMSSQSHARCARPTPRPARGPVATAARPSDNRARDGRWPSGASAGGPRNRPMPQVYASCSLRRRGSIFSPPVYRDNTVPYQSVLNARHIHVEREREEH